MKSQISNDPWNADLYDGKHSFVSNFGDRLIDLLDPKEGEKILDLGCGTGDLAKNLFDKKIEVIGIDKSENMINQAKTKYPEIEFFVEDATELSYHQEFDAVFSNAALHWIKTPKKALNCIYKSLKKDGRFIAEFGGKGNIKLISNEITQQIKEAGFEFNNKPFPWYFPSIGEYTSLMEEVGFKVTFSQLFNRPTALEGKDGLKTWIEMFASDMLEGIAFDKKEVIISRVEDHLKKHLYHNETWIADYKRIRVVGIKE
ncbi:class I SAM-dependent methyltransferase [Metabacillus litoralis]|uniref:class I SAM-dependent methyltransferase n=1 Tax=Metabacillus litoralis TaxID=152268 RepID=UPI001CFF3232|nr:class I SAM-dependent methyltransferase [Metabacillus litoralis]